MRRLTKLGWHILEFVPTFTTRDTVPRFAFMNFPSSHRNCSQDSKVD